ncbi:MAG: thiamine pyrophosphate-dependent enzyme [Candidatus Colwellbacteria bacterium]|nr:thiamine pyrophosphate-dependent enzyme [Candidatus Colwellbacteria bacterium]
MNISDLTTGERPTWCPGCANFVTLAAIKKALIELHSEGMIDIDKTVIVSDIGCGAKIYDYLNINGFYALHGRVIPTAIGIKVGNPELNVIGFGGDGGTYDEGMSHLVHASRTNPGITMMVANNRVFALTKGQSTSSDSPITNPLSIAAVSGAGFIARGSSTDLDHLSSLMKEAISHKGFSLLEIMQPCIIFRNDGVDIAEKMEMIAKPKEPNFGKNIDRLHTKDGRLPIGIFRKEERPSLEDLMRYDPKG